MQKNEKITFDTFGNARKFTTNGKDFQSSIERHQGRVLHKIIFVYMLSLTLSIQAGIDASMYYSDNSKKLIVTTG